LQILHDEYHVPNVVISSIPFKPWLSAIRPSSVNPPPSSPSLLCICSSAHPSAPPTVHAQTVPLIPGYFSGVGDLFSSLLLAHFDLKTPCVGDETPVSRATSWALTKTHAVLSVTHKYSETLPEEDRLPTDDEEDKKEPLRRIRRMKGRELRLIQCQDIIRSVEMQEIRKMELWTGFWDA
jgi:pyridoxine kinase